MEGPGRYAIRVSDRKDAWDDKADANSDGHDAFRCLRVVPPRYVFGANYFFPKTLWTDDFDAPPSATTPTEWVLLGHAGPPAGLGLAFGISHRKTAGAGPTEWDSTPTITTAGVGGTVPWNLSVVSLYSGLDWTVRWYLLPSLTLDWRTFAMVRFDIVDDAEVPASLSASAKPPALPIDATIAMTLGMGWTICQGLSVTGSALLGAPRVSAYYWKPDAIQRRSIYYDPTSVWLGFGLGADYSWE
jgi:hypothetical protein